jgi:hypothetical protein
MSGAEEQKVIKITQGQKQVVRNRPLSTNVPQDVGSIPATVIGVLPEDKNNLNIWVEQLYSMEVSDQDLWSIYELIRYKGFNRDEVLGQLKRRFPNPRDVIMVVILCNLQGPQRAALTPLANNQTLASLGIPASGGQGKQVLTCNKIAAATADLAAFYLKRLNVPKRMNVECPGWLQFPAAGSIKMPQNLREQHLEFHRRFSVIIGGTFREDIYNTMAANAYYDDRLKLF